VLLCGVVVLVLLLFVVSGWLRVCVLFCRLCFVRLIAHNDDDNTFATKKKYIVRMEIIHVHD